MSSVCLISCGIPCCRDNNGVELMISKAGRITAIVLGIIAVSAGACIFAGVPLISQAGTLTAWIATPTGGLLILTALAIRCIANPRTTFRENGNTNPSFSGEPAYANLPRQTTDEIRRGYERTSNTVQICVFKPSIAQNPVAHLNALTSLLDASCRRIIVRFLQRQGSDYIQGNGSDAGGLSRDYLDDLMRNLARNEEHFTDSTSGLRIPKGVDHESLSTFRQIGKVMMFCYQIRDDLIIGRHFDPAVFAAMLQFSADELDIPFCSFDSATKFRLYRCFLEAQEESGGRNAQLELLDLVSEDSWDENSLANAFGLARDVHICLPEEWEELELEDLTLTQVKEVHAKLVGVLAEVLDPALSSIQAMAQGMRDLCTIGSEESLNLYWNRNFFHNMDFNTFEASVQGSINRTELVENISYDDYVTVINRKVKWLKEWIQNEATDEELRLFLKLLSGGSALPNNKHIGVYRQYENFTPYPVFHTCSFSMDLAPGYVVQRDDSGAVILRDDTKEDFIAALKVMFGKDAGYSQS